MESLLDIINKIQIRNQDIDTILRTSTLRITDKNQSVKFNDLDKEIKKSFDLMINGNAINIVDGQKYHAIYNIGGGDCFFHSIIDSNVQLVYKGELLNKTYEYKRPEFVSKLREIAIQAIKDKKIINDQVDDQNKWYNDMRYSSYWADDYMISALCETFNITPVLIEPNGKVYCGKITEHKYLSEHKLYCEYFYDGDKNKFDTREVSYNDPDKLKKSQDKFILIYYTTGVHYEAIYVKNNDTYIKYFNGFTEFNQYNKELANHIIKTCGFKTKEEADDDTRGKFIESLIMNKNEVNPDLVLCNEIM